MRPRISLRFFDGFLSFLFLAFVIGWMVLDMVYFVSRFVVFGWAIITGLLFFPWYNFCMR